MGAALLAETVAGWGLKESCWNLCRKAGSGLGCPSELSPPSAPGGSTNSVFLLLPGSLVRELQFFTRQPPSIFLGPSPGFTSSANTLFQRFHSSFLIKRGRGHDSSGTALWLQSASCLPKESLTLNIYMSDHILVPCSCFSDYGTTLTGTISPVYKIICKEKKLESISKRTSYMLNLMAFFKIITDFYKIETFMVKSKDSYLGAHENTVSFDDAN